MDLRPDQRAIEQEHININSPIDKQFWPGFSAGIAVQRGRTLQRHLCQCVGVLDRYAHSQEICFAKRYESEFYLGKCTRLRNWQLGYSRGWLIQSTAASRTGYLHGCVFVCMCVRVCADTRQHSQALDGTPITSLVLGALPVLMSERFQKRVFR